MEDKAELAVAPTIEPEALIVPVVLDWKIRILDNSTYMLTSPLTNEEILCNSLDIENILRS